jgi:uncharacterized Zn-finger protein
VHTSEDTIGCIYDNVDVAGSAKGATSDIQVIGYVATSVAVSVQEASTPKQDRPCTTATQDAETVEKHNSASNRPFKCDTCQKTFSHKHHLTRHIWTHIGGKPFKCDKCQKSFSDRSNLIRHMRVHTGDKPFKCDTCQKTFSGKSDLVRHMQVHTGDKPFKCDTCQKTFTQKSTLVKHVREHTIDKSHTKQKRRRLVLRLLT